MTEKEKLIPTMIRILPSDLNEARALAAKLSAEIGEDVKLASLLRRFVLEGLERAREDGTDDAEAV